METGSAEDCAWTSVPDTSWMSSNLSAPAIPVEALWLLRAPEPARAAMSNPPPEVRMFTRSAVVDGVPAWVAPVPPEPRIAARSTCGAKEESGESAATLSNDGVREKDMGCDRPACATRVRVASAKPLE